MQKHNKHATFPFKFVLLIVLLGAITWFYWFLLKYGL